MLLSDDEKQNLQKVEETLQGVKEFRNQLVQEIKDLCSIIFLDKRTFNSYQKMFKAETIFDVFDSTEQISIRDKKFRKQFKETIIISKSLHYDMCCISNNYEVFITFKQVALNYIKYYSSLKKESIDTMTDVLEAMNGLV